MSDDKSSEDQDKCEEGCDDVEKIFYIPYHVQSDIEDIISALKSLFYFPLHMSTILNHLILDTLTYGLTLMIIGLEGEQPLEDFLSLIILVLTSLAIPIAPPTL
jgi:hypothetical protein